MLISFHALHYRVRQVPSNQCGPNSAISIHALHYRVRHGNGNIGIAGYRNFNPRTPLQSATLRRDPVIANQQHFNPRTPLQSATLRRDTAIPNQQHFNPRTPLQSATPAALHKGQFRGISIHALHYRVRPELPATGRDLQANFNPRTPLQSATDPLLDTFSLVSAFQSTHSITECDYVAASPKA